jgi:uncharacterized protein (DUF1330 family)
MGPDIVAYVEAIDATLAPFNGRFLVHGGEKTILEGDSKRRTARRSTIRARTASRRSRLPGSS